MPKRKLFQQDISTRYRRKLIRDESDELFALFNENSRTNSSINLNKSVSDNDDHDEIVNFNRVISEIEEQEIIPFSDLTNTSAYDFFKIITSDREDNVIIMKDNIRDEDNNLEKENDDFTTFLVQWAITHRISHVALSNLLSGLRTIHPIFSNFPKCAKTLLRTPQSSVTEMFPGQYCHFGS